MAAQLMEYQDDCWEYKLVGVVIHSGIADAGHYYSLINTGKDHRQATWEGTRDQEWTEFNDSHVSKYSVGLNFEKDCYGEGNSTSNIQGGNEWESFGGAQQHSKSAYMLVYERKEKSPVRIEVEDEIWNANLEKWQAKSEEFKKNKENRISLLKTQLSYKKGDEQLEGSLIKEQSTIHPLERECTTVSRDFYPFIQHFKSNYYSMDKLQQFELENVPVSTLEDGK